MAMRASPVFPFRLPDTEQAVALRVVSDYLRISGTQTATFLLGRSPFDGDAKILAEFSRNLLSSAALCDGLVELEDDTGAR